MVNFEKLKNLPFLNAFLYQQLKKNKKTVNL